MPAKKPVLRRTLKSDLRKVDAHVVEPHEYEEIPELTDEMLERGIRKRGGRPRSSNPRKLITLRLPADIIEKWRATGPGWQTRMAERLSRVPSAKRVVLKPGNTTNRSRAGKPGRAD
jgi:uncharacterized protein (DUF4415 family)